MKGYRFLPPAEEEMTEASLYYEAAQSGLGQEYLDDLQFTVNAVRERPYSGRPAGHGLRMAIFRRFPFVLIYAEEPLEIIVIAVAHQRRRPEYWRSREWG